MIKRSDIKKNTVLVIAGPTASGKSALALQAAEELDGVILNADASQIYQGIPIVSAAPTAEDKERAPHRLYEIFAPQKRGSVADWLLLAVEAIKEVWNEEKLPIVVGGTGFYLEALIQGASPIPETSPQIKEKVARIFAAGGTEALYDELCKVDADGARMVHARNTTRVRRALEIFWSTQKSIAAWFQDPYIPCLPEADFQIVAKLPPIGEIEQNCSARFDAMLEKGAVEEVKNLLRLNLSETLPVMKAIGVPELRGFLEGNLSLAEAAELAKLHTRQYAKRQLTWFRNRLERLPAHLVKTYFF